MCPGGVDAGESELIESIFPPPTLPEMMGEFVLDEFGRVIHF